MEQVSFCDFLNDSSRNGSYDKKDKQYMFFFLFLNYIQLNDSAYCLFKIN